MLTQKLSLLVPIAVISGRLWDISRPLFYMNQLINPYGNAVLLDAIFNIASERESNKRDTLEGRLVAIIKELTKPGNREQNSLWSRRLRLPISVELTMDRQETQKYESKYRTVQGRSEIILISQEDQTLLEQYGCKTSESSLPP